MQNAGALAPRFGSSTTTRAFVRRCSLPSFHGAQSPMRNVDWYFDFISPYAWLQAETLDRLPSDAVLACKPVLFAGLLEHWGQLGPAEIPPKRTFTYQYIVWRAHKLGLRACPPSHHPFNP